ncbi:hypothetical protein PR048_004214 [Dryococelus australis]|uniref:Calponin-homology (CH) domain-containing protein n=1 Tax=Dryococelus australis TaxID=614101 RepID=A0ABQ9I5X0_9NEOP|nr:hypothetical protein PR048_004214 [Dryococelus australis]
MHLWKPDTPQVSGRKRNSLEAAIAVLRNRTEKMAGWCTAAVSSYTTCSLYREKPLMNFLGARRHVTAAGADYTRSQRAVSLWVAIRLECGIVRSLVHRRTSAERSDDDEVLVERGQTRGRGTRQVDGCNTLEHSRLVERGQTRGRGTRQVDGCNTLEHSRLVEQAFPTKVLITRYTKIKSRDDEGSWLAQLLRYKPPPPTEADRVRFPAGSPLDFRTGFLGVISFPPPVHSGAAPYSPRLIPLVGAIRISPFTLTRCVASGWFSRGHDNDTVPVRMPLHSRQRAGDIAHPAKSSTSKQGYLLRKPGLRHCSESEREYRLFTGLTMGQWSERSPPTTTNRLQFPAESYPNLTRGNEAGTFGGGGGERHRGGLRRSVLLLLLQARMEVEDLFTDLADGKKLLKLLEIISGEKLGKPNNGKMRVHRVENVNKSLAFLHTKVSLTHYLPNFLLKAGVTRYLQPYESRRGTCHEKYGVSNYQTWYEICPYKAGDAMTGAMLALTPAAMADLAQAFAETENITNYKNSRFPEHFRPLSKEKCRTGGRKQNDCLYPVKRTRQDPAYLELSSAFEAEKCGSDKVDTATRIKSVVAAKRRSLYWRAAFSSCCDVVDIATGAETNFLVTVAKKASGKLDSVRYRNLRRIGNTEKTFPLCLEDKCFHMSLLLKKKTRVGSEPRAGLPSPSDGLSSWDP